jgi:uncharacterized protein YndB with AHSA1/START domain
MTPFAGNSNFSGRAIEVEIVTRAHPARVWEALTDPQRIVEWFADRALGEVQPGAILRWSFDRLSLEMSFRVVQVTGTSGLVLSGDNGTPGRLEILVGLAHDGTRVTLSHGEFPEEVGEEDYRALASGWRLALAVLRYYVEFHFAEPRRHFFALRSGRFSPHRLHTLFREPAGLQEWLTDGGSMGTPGGRVHLALKNGETLRGDMLADAGSDVALAWDEIGGVLQFRTLPGSHERDMRSVCAMGWGWGLREERAKEIERYLASSLERLERAAEPAIVGQGTALQSR